MVPARARASWGEAFTNPPHPVNSAAHNSRKIRKICKTNGEKKERRGEERDDFMVKRGSEEERKKEKK
jgi:hypothetical protein